MRLLVDECVDERVCNALMENGVDCALVRNLSHGADDPDVMMLAVKENRVILTEDKGFGAHVFAMGWRSSGVVLVRTRVADDATARRVAAQVMSIGDAAIGAFTTIDDEAIRSRPLP